MLLGFGGGSGFAGRKFCALSIFDSGTDAGLGIGATRRNAPPVSDCCSTFGILTTRPPPNDALILLAMAAIPTPTATAALALAASMISNGSGSSLPVSICAAGLISGLPTTTVLAPRAVCLPL